MDTLFFIVSKVVWLLISPGTLLLLTILAGLALLYLNRIRLAKIVLAVTVFLFLVITIFPIDEWTARPLEKRFENNPELPGQIDGIIMLGGALMSRESSQWQQSELSDSAERYFSFIVLAKRYPDAQLVFTGGSGHVLEQEFREADFARDFFHEAGLDTERILFERDSRNTWENAVNSRALARPLPGQQWILITSAMHMPRSVGIFCRQNWPVIPYPVDHNTSPDSLLRLEFDFIGNLDLLTRSTREWLGLLAYSITGKTTALFPAQCR